MKLHERHRAQRLRQEDRAERWQRIMLVGNRATRILNEFSTCGICPGCNRTIDEPDHVEPYCWYCRRGVA